MQGILLYLASKKIHVFYQDILINDIYTIIVCKIMLPYVILVIQFNYKISDYNYKSNIMQTTDIIFNLGETSSL